MSMQKSILLLALAAILPASQFSYSADDPTSWAQKQMRHMLADRPTMKNYHVGNQILWINQQDSIWQWVAERYAGKTTQFWTAWHEAAPIDAEAMHAYGQDKAYVYVEDMTARGTNEHNAVFERLWRSVVFELFNLENAEGFHQADLAAYNGSTSRSEYVKAIARLEHRALGKLQQFHRDIWLPWSKDHGLNSEASIWQHGYDPDFDAWLGRYPATFRYPWQIYGERYDKFREAGANEKATGKSPAN